MPRQISARPIGAVCIAALLLAACSDTPAEPTTVESVAATSTTVRPDDGVLSIGAILPQDSGNAAELGLSMSAALTLAVTEINSAGGVLGSSVRLTIRDEGENAGTATIAMNDLIDLGVDAIVGPTSSTNTLATLGAAVDAGILVCSPTASALALDRFPDRGLFFRTIASDSLQAKAIAALVESSGTNSAVVVYLDDGYGRPFAEAARQAILTSGAGVAEMVGYTPNAASIANAVDLAVGEETDVIVVIADATSGPAMIDAIDEASNNSPTFVVNDQIRRPATSTQPWSRSLSERVQGASPLAYSQSTAFLESLRAVDPTVTGLFAHNAYDCLNAIALAAVFAKSANPVDISRQMAVVTDGGTLCSNFMTCADALAAGRNIDYSGPARDLTIGVDGELLSSVFERFGFNASGQDVGDGFITVSN